ncbi:alpha/beta hydrolase [Smaragdicoccus niigatensis]|uniref:alpha/beta hydrolase n=1 Tax=Smaragdicoccus niigatensis TaxID=359359 RepID=UPI00036AC447|nr:alpha/beta hydrolase [Smaragdicoccus niigatensis]
MNTVISETTIAGFPALKATGNGTKPSIVLLHGAFADYTGFEAWLAAFSELGHDVIAPSRSGRNGVGPAKAEGLTFDDYINDTIKVLDTLDEKPIIIGHSLGGLIAQKLAEQGRARAIALIASAPPGMLTAQPIALSRFIPQMPKIMTGRPFAMKHNTCDVLALNQMASEQRQAFFDHYTHESGKVYRSLLLGTVRVNAKKVTVPVFVAGGAKDRIVSTGLVKSTAKHYGTTPHIYDDGGHFLISEPVTPAVIADVAEWLSASL